MAALLKPAQVMVKMTGGDAQKSWTVFKLNQFVAEEMEEMEEILPLISSQGEEGL